MMKRDSVVLALGGLLGLMVLVPAYAENKTVTLSVPGMDCEACPITVSKALKKVDGVGKVAASVETMPTDACQFFYECKGCGAVLKPNPGDCCVFCSFGSVKCPPRQAKNSRSS